MEFNIVYTCLDICIYVQKINAKNLLHQTKLANSNKIQNNIVTEKNFKCAEKKVF